MAFALPSRGARQVPGARHARHNRRWLPTSKLSSWRSEGANSKSFRFPSAPDVLEPRAAVTYASDIKTRHRGSERLRSSTSETTDPIKESGARWGWRVSRGRKVDRVSRLQLTARVFRLCGNVSRNLTTTLCEKYHGEYARFATGRSPMTQAQIYAAREPLRVTPPPPPRYLNTTGHYCVVKTITTTARGETTRGRNVTYCGAGDRRIAEEPCISQRYLILLIVLMPDLVASLRDLPFLTPCWKWTYIAHKYPMSQGLL